MCIYIYIFYYSIDQPWEYLMDGIKNIPIRPDRGSTKLSGVLETSPALFLQSVAFKLFEDRTFVPLFATRWFLLILCANREPNFSLSLSCPLSRRSTENNFITLLFLFFFFFSLLHQTIGEIGRDWSGHELKAQRRVPLFITVLPSFPFVCRK